MLFVQPQHPIAAFTQQAHHEFITASAVAPELFKVAVELVSDTHIGLGGEVSDPIADALNWQRKQGGFSLRQTRYAALLLNEDGSCWQAKLNHPRQDAKGKIQKYETPVGNGSRAYLPAIPPEIRQLISHRYDVEVPLSGSFWDWLEAHPEIPIVLTEGGKKALALFSQGFVSLALYGVNGGYQRLLDGTRKLIPDLQRFATPGRRFTLAFDQDEKDATQRRVAIALHRFGGLLRQAGTCVSVATWKANQGKGVDDLIVQGGAAAWQSAYASALPLEHWQIWQRLEKRLTYPATVKVTTADLSTLTLDNLPEQGILAIQSAKGTGKTKQIHTLVAETEKVLAGGHRIALMRNLSTRLGLNYRGDLDKVKGEFITGAGYTCRIGLCLDSILSIDPAKFAGCDLILDEVVQVVRHLLTSSTCARDGKRPALLARFRELIQVAQRVIVADADLDNATLHYLRELRGEDTPIFLLRNDYQPDGYPVQFLQSPDRSEVIARVIADVQTLEPGKVLFIATDSKGTSKAIARLLSQSQPDQRVLLVNSETSGGECEREFIQTPDVVLQRGEYDVIICSPSVATGVSIEAQGAIAKVYGIFTGTSSTDADMAQALGRVREPVERVIWCAKSGSNFSTVSRSTNPLELKSHLQQQTTTTIRLIRSSLKEDVPHSLDAFDWQRDPHLHLYAHFAAQQNFAMHHLRDALLVRLKYEGNQVTVQESGTNPAMKQLLQHAKQEVKEMDAETLVAAPVLTYSEVQSLEQKESPTPEEMQAVAKFYLQDFYCLDSLSVEAVLQDQEGRWRGELLNLEAQLFPDLAVERTAKALEKQAKWNQGMCPWDIAHAQLRRVIREEIGMNELIAKLRSGWQWCKYDLAAYAQKARALAPQIKVALHFSVSDKLSDTQIVHQLLSQLGVKVSFVRWSRSLLGYEGEKLRVYSLNQTHWHLVWDVLERRQAKRQALASSGSPTSLEIKIGADDPPAQVLEWLQPEALADVQQWWEAAAGDPTAITEISRLVPPFVLQHLGLVV